MTETLKQFAVLAWGLMVTLAPAFAHAQPQHVVTTEDFKRLEQHLDELKAIRNDFEGRINVLDTHIDALEAEIRGLVSEPSKPVAGSATAAYLAPAPTTPLAVAVTPQQNTYAVAIPQPVRPAGSIDLGSWGSYEPGDGYVFIRGDDGQISMSLITYVRYLNQLGLDRTYTDAFGRTKTLDLRQDVNLNKVNLTFKGWVFDPNFSFVIFTWTQNAAQGLPAQVVIGGQLAYRFNDYFSIHGGVGSLPSTRTTNWTYPNWLKMDNRTIADEFFRASYTFGFWADGKIAPGLLYRVMIANNLSALGVDAAQLDNDFSTFSGALWWMPTTGEYGPGEGFGDFENHQRVATRFGVHYTRSREDSQSQPSTDDFENSQIRLSDGTQIFQPGAFNTDGQIRKATYQMTAANAGFKFRGWSLEAEYYARWVDDFQTIGFIPVTNLFDQGFQVQASAMVLPKKLQLYMAGSEVLGQYGDPWDLSLGLNWYPFSRREVRVNAEGIYLSRSPVGGISYPYVVGGNGWLFNTDFIVAF